MQIAHTPITETYIYYLVLFAVAGLISYKMLPYLSKFFRSRNQGEDILDFLSRAHEDAMDEIDTAKHKEETKYGSRKRLLIVGVTNFVGLYLLALLVIRIPAIALYPPIGLIIIGVIKAVPEEKLKGLGFSDRLWLRIFYSWFWPIYIWVLASKRANKGE